MKEDGRSWYVVHVVKIQEHTKLWSSNLQKDLIVDASILLKYGFKNGLCWKMLEILFPKKLGDKQRSPSQKLCYFNYTVFRR